MNSSDSNPKLPLWIFILTDLVLLALAVLIAMRSTYPFAMSTTLAIVACALAGTLVGLVPLVMHFERQKNEALDDRQRALEALARTISSSAEQISIATAGLNEVTELSQKTLRHAEQLPHKLQEKIAEFQAQLANATDVEKEELEKELTELRGSETERLESISDKIARATGELAKIEAATHQHLTVANEAIAKLALGTANAIGKAQAAAEQALAQARVEAARGVGEAAGQAKGKAIAEIDTHIAAAGTAVVERFARDFAAKLTPTITALEEKLARIETASRRVGAPGVAETARAETIPAAPATVAPEPTVAPENATPVETTMPAPKRPRKPRREDGDTTGVATAEPAAAAPIPSESAAAPETNGGVKDEPPPIRSEKIPEITPVAPGTAEPFAGNLATSAATTTASPAVAPAAEAPKPVRKRAAKKTEPAADVSPALALDEAAANAETRVRSELIERVLSSDGATRLLVTAYIGIGNRVFIRGDGPGLSWDKGVPLQFVSIGKWRWETNDATTPVRFKLLKNDDQECAALGAQSLDPGHQQEVTAAF
jgi:hypothetical protein